MLNRRDVCAVLTHFKRLFLCSAFNFYQWYLILSSNGNACLPVTRTINDNYCTYFTWSMTLQCIFYWAECTWELTYLCYLFQYNTEKAIYIVHIFGKKKADNYNMAREYCLRNTMFLPVWVMQYSIKIKKNIKAKDKKLIFQTAAISSVINIFFKFRKQFWRAFAVHLILVH